MEPPVQAKQKGTSGGSILAKTHPNVTARQKPPQIADVARTERNPRFGYPEILI